MKQKKNISDLLKEQAEFEHAAFDPKDQKIYEMIFEELSVKPELDIDVFFAQEVVEVIEKQEEVSWVNYPGLKSAPYHEMAKKYLPKGQSSLVSFGLKGDYETAQKVVVSVKYFFLLANIGDTKSLIIHPLQTHLWF